MDEKSYWLGFSVFKGIGPVKFSLLLKSFTTAKNAWHADVQEVSRILGENLAGQFEDFRKKFSIEKEIELLSKKKITFVTLLDKEYPNLLKQISSRVILSPFRTKNLPKKEDPSAKPQDDRFSDNSTRIPFVLYIRGNITLLNDIPAIAVVGTRKITQYGKDVTEQLTGDLVANNFVIVSGLAFGVDAVAHNTAIENNGKTIAVLGCGVDCCYPTENTFIYDAILDSGGTIVSSFRPGENPNKGTFPARNATVAGISLGVLVTEGAIGSGALITAEYAKKFGRSLFAVPGPITSGLSKAPNSLLQKGAIPVTDVDDILNNLKFKISNLKLIQNEKNSKQSNKYLGINRQEKEILDILSAGPLHFDDIVRRIGKDSKSLGSLLSMMEIKGMIKNNASVYSL